MQNQISKLKAATIFILSTIYFYILLFTLLPFLKSGFIFNPAIYWFITGYFLFIPLFILALVLVKSEGKVKFSEITDALKIKKMNKKDWQYSIITTVIIFTASGIIFAVSLLLNKFFGTSQINTTPWFMTFSPFEGYDKLLLLVWLPMFTFNILGEELLWRGYIQSRLIGKHSWILCSFLWLLFHLPFGFDLMILLIPIIILLPYSFYKTQNTLVGVFIHSVYNGPMFILISLGIIS
jgi:membrane protease YdiL (CAAX protease family)